MKILLVQLVPVAPCLHHVVPCEDRASVLLVTHPLSAVFPTRAWVIEVTHEDQVLLVQDFLEQLKVSLASSSLPKILSSKNITWNL